MNWLLGQAYIWTGPTSCLQRHFSGRNPIGRKEPRPFSNITASLPPSADWLRWVWSQPISTKSWLVQSNGSPWAWPLWALVLSQGVQNQKNQNQIKFWVLKFPDETFQFDHHMEDFPVIKTDRCSSFPLQGKLLNLTEPAEQNCSVKSDRTGFLFGLQ